MTQIWKDFVLNALAVGIAGTVILEWHKYFSKERKVSMTESMIVTTVVVLFVYLWLYLIFGFHF